MDNNTAPPSTTDAVSSTIIVQVMIAAVIVIFFVVVLLSYLYLYARWWSMTENPSVVSWRRRAGRQTAAAKGRGLDTSALQSLPVVEYDPKDFKDGLECAVCLSELSQGEKARVLPKCNHGFHVDCIDMWFKSNSTCPLCRTPVISAQNPSSINPNNVAEEVNVSLPTNFDEHGRPQNPAFPTNVLYWGDETQVRSLDVGLEVSNSLASTSRDHGLVIEMPANLCENCLCSPSSLEEGRSPVMNKLRSLKRLLSRGKRVAAMAAPPSPSPRASSSGDVEQV